MNLNWETVVSSNIEAVAWHGGDMYVRFHFGRVYKYDDVEKRVFLSCRDARSVGSYFIRNVKDAYSSSMVAA